MIIQKELLNKLKDFGLNSYESKLWTALLSRGSSTAGELSDIAGVPRSRSYDVLESLERKGFIVMKLGKPIQYVAVSPSDVLDRLKSKTVIEADEKIQHIENLKTSDIINELNNLHNEGISLVEPSEISGSIRGQTNIDSHLELMFKKAKESISVLFTNKHTDKRYLPLLDLLKDAKKRGVKTKVYSKNSKKFAELAKHSTLVNTSVPGMMCIIDNNELMFMLTDENTHPSYEAAVWLSTKFFATSLSDMLESAK